MKQGICSQTLIPVRSKSSHQSEQLTQLLFGDCYTVLEVKNEWIKIQIDVDDYVGWIPENQFSLISDSDFTQFQENYFISSDIITTLIHLSNNTTMLLAPGSIVINFHDGKFSFGENNYLTEGKLTQSCDLKASRKEIIDNAKKFINSPYLWGGKTPFGIDCSGLIQIVYRLSGIKLPRDTTQQVNVGEEIDHLSNSNPGDLVFFNNEREEICHVGILLNREKVIHSSGYVRIDPIDNKGIFRPESNAYSHKLMVIKKII